MKGLKKNSVSEDFEEPSTSASSQKETSDSLKDAPHNPSMISSSKEEIKRRISDQANRVRDFFPNASVADESRIFMRATPKQKDVTSYSSAAVECATTDLGGISTEKDTPPQVEVQTGDPIKRRKLSPIWNMYSDSPPLDFVIDESIFDEDSPEKGSASRPCTPPNMKRSYSVTSTLSYPGMSDHVGRKYLMEHTSSCKQERQGKTPASKPQKSHDLKHDFPVTSKLSHPPYSDITFNSNDIVWDARGNIIEGLVGNHRFFVLLNLHQENYCNAASTVERFGTAQKIVNAIRQAVPPGRFIQMEESMDRCSLLTGDAFTRMIEQSLSQRMDFKFVGEK